MSSAPSKPSLAPTRCVSLLQRLKDAQDKVTRKFAEEKKAANDVKAFDGRDFQGGKGDPFEPDEDEDEDDRRHVEKYGKRGDGDGPADPAGAVVVVPSEEEDDEDIQAVPPPRGGLLALMEIIRTQRMSRAAASLEEEQQQERNVTSSPGCQEPKVHPVIEIGLEEEKLEDPRSELERKIIRQVEHYFGDYNLPKDRFLLEKMEEDFGWIPMTTMMTFKRLSTLTTDSAVVMQALSKSTSGLMEVDLDNKRIRRNPRLPLPEMNDARRISLQERTVFVAGFDRQTTTLDELIDYFESNFNKVCNIRMRMFRHPDVAEKDDVTFLGSVFVTFTSRHAASELVQRKLQYKGKNLICKWQHDFFHQKTEFNDEFDAGTIDRTIFVHGFDNLETPQEELSDFFSQFPGTVSVRRRVFRDRRENYDVEDIREWKFTGSVFVTFTDRDKAGRFLRSTELNYKGDKLRKMWQKDFYAEKGKFGREIRNMESQ